jgi:hypothetical protein
MLGKNIRWFWGRIEGSTISLCTLNLGTFFYLQKTVNKFCNATKCDDFISTYIDGLLQITTKRQIVTKFDVTNGDCTVQ